VTVIVGDCREVMAGMAEASVDAVVTDPPYGLEFMGKEWDKLDRSGFHNGKGHDRIGEADGTPFRRHTGTPGFASQARGNRCDVCGKYAGGNPKINCQCESPKFRHMSRGFEQQQWHETWAREAFRVLKPGGHLLAFGGTRTFHRMTVAIEDAGFEIRDCLSWLYGSGFPKSLDVSKAIDKRRNDDIRPVCRFLRSAIDQHATWTVKSIAEHFGFHARMVEHWAARDTDSQPSVPTWDQWLQLKALLGFGDEMDAEVWRLNGRKGQPGEAWHEREVTGVHETLSPSDVWRINGQFGGESVDQSQRERRDIPATPEAEQWAGWGTALKPAWEPVIVARKPLVGTVAANVLAHGTGALNIDACRLEGAPPSVPQPALKSPTGLVYGFQTGHGRNGEMSHAEGRWPANVALDEAAARLLDEMSGERKSGKATGYDWTPSNNDNPAHVINNIKSGVHYGDSGGPSRYFLTVPLDDPDAEVARFAYVAKASRRERNAGLEGMPEHGAGVGHRAVDAGEYAEFVHPAPDGIGAWLREHRDRAGLTLKDVARHFPSKTGGLTGCVTNWEREYNRPTPEQWWALKRVLGFGDEYDSVMTETRTVPRELFDDRPRPTAQNVHPTVKPIALMRWLVRLVTPPGGTVLDPFAGSASTGCACALEGFAFIGIEQSAEYAEIAERRIAHWSKRPAVLQPALPLEGAAD
jgi:DNA modification methylase